jgi:hypothetical protein
MTGDFMRNLILFVPLCLAVLLVLSFVGGWLQLSLKYKAIDTFDGQRWWFQTGSLRSVNYSSCLIVGASPQGLRLATLFLFRPFHPPLLIPWQDIAMDNCTVLFGKRTRLRFSQCPSVTLRLGTGLMLKVVGSLTQDSAHSNSPTIGW